MNNVEKIRELLKKHCEWCLAKNTPNYLEISGCGAEDCKICGVENCKITQALSLLPCETCNGTRIIPGHFSDYCKDKPCPDNVPDCISCNQYTPRKLCPDCQPCQTCGGLGQIVTPRKDIPGVDWEPCETCGGTGKKLISGCFGMVHKEIPCPDCKGDSE